MTDSSLPDRSDVEDANERIERRACAVCGRILNSYMSPGGQVEWIHTFADLPEDHPAVPVGLNDGITARGRCDFCSAEDPAWEIPARSFLLPRPAPAPPGNHTDPHTDNASHGNWAGCNTCVSLIETNQWTGLRRRALAAWTDTTPDPAIHLDVDHKLSQLYRLLRRHITGPARRIPPPNS